MTKLIASNRLDFPDPFSPTTAVSPSKNGSTVFLRNDLKPLSSTLLIFVMSHFADRAENSPRE